MHNDSSSMHFNNEWAIFKKKKLLVKNVDPMGFHILQQLVAFGNQSTFEILKFFWGYGQKRNINFIEYFPTNAQEGDLIK
jgi:hypothetical protein